VREVKGTRKPQKAYGNGFGEGAPGRKKHTWPNKKGEGERGKRKEKRAGITRRNCRE